MFKSFQKTVTQGLALAFFSVATPSLAMAADTPYKTVKELKAFDDHIGVYLADSVPHGCGTSDVNKTRFLLRPDQRTQYTLLLAAYLSNKEVNLRYTCDSSGLPRISGVRVR